MVYRPTVLFLYAPCRYATRYFEQAKVNEYPHPDPNKPQDCEDPNGITIIRGYRYPNKFEILYQEKIDAGTAEEEEKEPSPEYAVDCIDKTGHEFHNTIL